jgi:FKBP-type peptidyl-prolyl cis-trans isomerase
MHKKKKLITAMNKLLLILFVSLSFVAQAQDDFPQGTAELKDEVDSLSYALGVNMAGGLHQLGVDSVDLLEMFYGLQDQLTNKSKMTPQEAEAFLQNFMGQLRTKQSLALQVKANEYMVANSHAEGVVKLKSGLQYKVLTKGKGPIPKDGDTVRTHYTGKLIDGKIFDSSVERGTPFEFPLGNVIPGWQEALKLMPVGSKWMLYIPPNLAYGERKNGLIEPYSVLIFEIELLDIVHN